MWAELLRRDLLGILDERVSYGVVLLAKLIIMNLGNFEEDFNLEQCCRPNVRCTACTLKFTNT